MIRWLLIEDEPDLYEVLTYLYNDLNAEAIAYTTGEDVLAWLDTLSSPDAVQRDDLPVFALIDIRLPGDVNGVEVAYHLRQHPLLGSIPIVLMTAYRLSPREEREMMARSSANHLLYKPLPSFKELHKIFNDLT